MLKRNGTDLHGRDRLFLGWVGPRGMASLVFGLLAYIDLTGPDAELVLAVMVVNGRDVQNRIVQMDRYYSAEELRRAANFLNNQFAGKELNQVRTDIVAELAQAGESLNQLMRDAIKVAQQTGTNPRSMVMGIAIACSMAFITPLGHAVNILVMSPGGYKFRDYVRVGLPMTAILFVVVMIFLPLFWPL